MSTSLVGLAGDLASFKNINIEEVTTALSSVFTGETRKFKTFRYCNDRSKLETVCYGAGHY